MAARKAKKVSKKTPSRRKTTKKKSAPKAEVEAQTVDPEKVRAEEEAREAEQNRLEEEARQKVEAERQKHLEEEQQRAQERERERVRAREERARMKEQRRREQEQKRRDLREGKSNVASLADARARQGAQPRPTTAPTASGKDEGPKPFQMNELHKYKLTVLNANYNTHLTRLKKPLIQKYNLMMKVELDALSGKDQECVKARREQILCVNEIINVMTPMLPPGYAITQFRAEEGVVIAEYIPERAGKPLQMPEPVTDEG